MFSDCIDECFGSDVFTPAAVSSFIGSSTPAKFNDWSEMNLDSREKAKEDYRTCNSLASIAWKEMISKRNEKLGATILTAAALIMTVLSFVF